MRHSKTLKELEGNISTLTRDVLPTTLMSFIGIVTHS